MNFISNIKWYYIMIICLLGVILFLVLTNTYSHEPCICKNAPETSEGFNSNQEQEQKQETYQEQEESKIKGEIIIYYAMWCGYSRQFLPEWEKFEEYAKKNLPQVRVLRVRCEDGHEATCSQKGVTGYPTVILYLKDGTEKLFEDERRSDKLINFVQNNL